MLYSTLRDTASSERMPLLKSMICTARSWHSRNPSHFWQRSDFHSLMESSRVGKITAYPSRILLLTVSVWCQRPLFHPAPNHNQQRERWRMTLLSLICVFVLLKFQGLLSGDCFSLCSPVSCWWKASSVPGMDNTPQPPCVIAAKEKFPWVKQAFARRFPFCCSVAH